MTLTKAPVRLLHFKDHAEYRRTLAALARQRRGNDRADLCEVARPSGGFAIPLGAALFDLTTARQEARKVARRRARA